MKVLVVRHAIAVERGQAGQGSDEERPLTPKGVRRMRRAAQGIARLAPRLDAIFTSPLVRAVETARLLTEAYGGSPKPQTARLLAPGHPPGEVARWLRSLDEESVALVGHEPGCSKLVSHLLAGRARLDLGFKKGGAALLEVEPDRQGLKGALVWHATPRLLRLAGR
jgi:phosphohistidine phosphatase